MKRRMFLGGIAGAAVGGKKMAKSVVEHVAAATQGGTPQEAIPKWTSQVIKATWETEASGTSNNASGVFDVARAVNTRRKNIDAIRALPLEYLRRQSAYDIRYDLSVENVRALKSISPQFRSRMISAEAMRLKVDDRVGALERMINKYLNLEEDPMQATYNDLHINYL